ncbi:hypothetical protein KAR91_64140 [Candidatus Pacearchaeota archaeon]|nr:hypothetical protein [Candidatus Pacearchaeota archaeon]
MAAGPSTRVSDVVVPEIFTPYVQQLTEQKARIIQSGIAVRDPAIDELLAGGGLTFNVPSFRDLDDDTDRVSTDTPSIEYSGGTADPDPFKIETSQEVAVRLNRNNSWSSADLAAVLAGTDPMEAIAARVAFYWTRRLQAVFVATMNGVIADNTSGDAGDYTNDISGASYVAGVTDFSAEAFLDAAVTMGDSMEDLTGVLVHSVVFSRMQKNNLIDFIPDARGEIQIPTFLGREVVVDDGLPATGSVYDTWLFGAGSVRLGVGTPKVPTEIERHAGAGNGGGQEVLYSRNEWSLHPVGHAYTGTSPNGGPGNGAGANDLQNAGSWNRVYPERKQIKFARLVTREA